MNSLKGRFPIAVAIGAIFGALSRFYITDLAKAMFGKDFGFYGTFFINVTGCLIIALYSDPRNREYSPHFTRTPTDDNNRFLWCIYHFLYLRIGS